MNSFLKIFLFVMLTTVGEAKSSTVISTLRQEPSFGAGAIKMLSGISKIARPVTQIFSKGRQSFSKLMPPSEVARYNAYWSRTAPVSSTPNSRMIWNRISPRTGQLEKSVLTYDKAGRLNFRIDFSTHMRPAVHSNPHLHQFEYTPLFDPIKGKETLFNFW